ncbi:MAG: glutathione S-transferase family protein [Rhodospirillaceae bacterium]|jgi:glutathione S-transferase|nr:glutathione S-transferase family protein [Rhodospirillaceae bacterium]MBT3492241.1 glutathione S-transferase family protein [Rhodospirillaceae bacterium]MBT3779433.1 glutathione S-transferase family protein [Rhodospirillaceae bacterium]MBT3975096.1 glutathione S-transferase family protein [Rhodospirillaceae bacterium]MBT4167205.1 glutathione S-transferase family protein [Rhodospirillaceae bacterium]
MSDGIVLWGAVSIRALRVHWALQELGLDYQFRPILSRSGETLTAEYTGHNPKQKIPCLQDGEFTLTESPAIVNYLFNAYGEGADVHLSQTVEEQARADEWSYFAMMEMDAHSLYVIRRHKFLSEIYGEAPVAVASAAEYCLKQINAVAPAVAEFDPYIFGDRISAADILLASTINFAERYEVELPASCRAYRDRAYARPAFQAANARNEDLDAT